MKSHNFLLSIVATFVLALNTQAAEISSLIENKIDVSKSSDKVVTKLINATHEKQERYLAMAFEIASKDGHEYPELLQGILMQESKAGGMKSYKVAGGEYGLATNKRYYGLAQIKLSAAQDVLKSYPSLWSEFEFQTRTDEEIIAKLIENPRFNISVASKYLLILRKYGYTSPNRLAIAYNRGPGGAKNAGPSTHYSVGVFQHINNIVNITVEQVVPILPEKITVVANNVIRLIPNAQTLIGRRDEE